VSANLDFSLVSSQYQPEEPSDAITPQYPQQAWQVNQTWLMLSDRMVGKVNMTSLTNHQDKYVRMRIRTAPGGLLQGGPTTFTASGTDLTLYENDFTGVAIGPAVQADAYGQPDADEIFLTEKGASDPATYTAGQSHTIALNVSPSTTDGLSGFDYLTNGTLSGFRAQTDLDNYYVWFNTGSAATPLNFTFNPSSWLVLTNLFVGGPGTPVVTPTVVTGTIVNTTVPAYGSVCIQETRNLMPNPGFEQVTSGVPNGFTFETLQGSPTITLDSTDPSHGGNNSVEVTGTGSAEGGVLAPKITIAQGNYYQVTYWYKSGTGLSSSAIVTRLTAWEANGTMTPWSTSWIQSITGGTYTVTGNQLYIAASNPTPGTWNSVTITFTLSNPTVSLGVECLNWLGSGSVWYDDLFVEETN